MTSPSLTPLHSSGLAWAAAGVGYSLLGLFGCAMLGWLLPPKLLDPGWQLQVSSTLVSSGGYPLLGLFLALLGASINPADIVQQKRLRQLQAPPIAAEVAARPIAALRTHLLGRIQARESTLQQPLLTALGALVQGFGFAGMAVPPARPPHSCRACWGKALAGRGGGQSWTYASPSSRHRSAFCSSRPR